MSKYVMALIQDISLLVNFVNFAPQERIYVLKTFLNNIISDDDLSQKIKHCLNYFYPHTQNVCQKFIES